MRVCEKENKTSEFLFKFVLALFPGVKKNFLETYHTFLTHSKFQSQRKQAVLRCHVREKLELRRKSQDLILENLEKKFQDRQFSQAFEEHSAKLKQLHKELAEKRKEHDKVQKEVERKQKLKEEQTKRELELQKAQFERHAQMVKSQAEAYKQAKHVEIKQALLEQQQKFKQQQAELKQQIESKVADVQKRQVQAEQEVAYKLGRKQAKLSEEEERRERIREAVESYKSRPIVERDPRRMMAETEALVIKKETKEYKPIFGNPGYYDEKLMNDPRFKLQTRLFEAGLHQTDYAAAVLNMVHRGGKQ